MQVRSEAYATKQVTDCSTWLLTSEMQQQPESYVTAESQAPSSETTCVGKSRESNLSTQAQKSLKTSGQGLTSNAKGFKPYWDDSCKERSSNLFLPTETACVGSGSSYSNTFSSNPVGQSWFLTQQWQSQEKSLFKTYLQSSTTSPAECMEAEVTKLLRVRRVRVYPTTQQKLIFKQWFGTSRKVYNETVALLNLPGKKPHWMAAAGPLLAALPEWAKAVPYQVKKMAVSDAYKSFSNGVRKFKKKGQAFSLSFRSRKDPRQSCFIPSSAISTRGVYPTITKDLKWAEDITKSPRDSRLIYENDRWFVAIPEYVTVAKAENQGRAVALDPGVRTFLTAFSEDSVVKIGEQAFQRIRRLGSHMDALQSRMSQVKAKQRRSLKKALNRIKWKVWNLIDELHFKSAKYLTDNFDLIYLPTFETSQMVVKSSRKIRSKVVRSMLTLSHYKFKARLKAKAEALGKTVLDVCEAYTSKTVSWTGEMRAIGGAKAIKSGSITMDRDVNGARGIYLRALVDNPKLRRQIC